jgi:hypothetical protein
MVKPNCVPCKYSPQFCQQILVTDDGENITVLVGAGLENSDFLLSIFGAASTDELKL